VAINKFKITLAAVLLIIVMGFVYIYHLNLRSPTKEIIIRFTYQPSTHHIAAFLVLHYHWIEEAAAELGYKVKIVEECYGSGPPQMERFAAGAIEVAYVGATPVISEVGAALAKGYPKAVIVAAVNLQGSALAMRPDFKYENPQSLRGATVGTFPPGSIQDTILKDWLGRNGLSYGPPGATGVDVYIRPADPRELITLLESRMVDGIFTPSPSPELCELKGIGKIVLTSADMVPNHPCCVLALRDSFIKEYPDMAEIIVKCHIKAERFIIQNRTEAVNVAAKKLAQLWGESEEDVTEIVEKAIIDNPTKLSFTPDPHLVVDGIMQYVEVHWELGYIPVKPTAEDLFDFTIYDKVTQELE